MQPNVESLTFKVGLSGTYWDRLPKFSILIDDAKVAEGSIIGPSGQIQYVEFSYDVLEEQDHKLQIRLENKIESDTVQSADKSTILKDMLLNIHSVEIEEVDLGSIIWTSSEFVGDDPARPVLKNCVNLGWNGTYALNFASPFYLWLLENI